MPRKTMIEAIRDAMDVMMGRDEKVVVFGEDVGFFGGVFRCTQGLQAKYGKSRCFDAPISRIRHRRRGDRHGRLRPAALRRGAVRRLCLSGLRPDRFGGRAPALPLQWRFHLSDRGAHADRRRHLWRPDPQPEPGSAVHPRLRPEDRGAVQPARRQGPADRGDRGPRSGHLPGAEAALQRAVRRPSRPPGDAVVEACARAKWPTAIIRSRSARR